MVHTNDQSWKEMDDDDERNRDLELKIKSCTLPFFLGNLLGKLNLGRILGM